MPSKEPPLVDVPQRTRVEILLYILVVAGMLTLIAGIVLSMMTGDPSYALLGCGADIAITVLYLYLRR